jgi:hypothetical protein
MADVTLPFVQLGSGVGIGSPAPAGWESIADCPLLVVVGVTGVGKSTALQSLAADLDYCLLPDRRDLTDRLIIPSVQAERGEPQEPVRDRKARFAYTRAYREQNPGGMAHALAQLQIETQVQDGALLFDGLRGANEVAHAAALLPYALFVVLEAPDAVRVARLMGRNDPFDQISGERPSGAETATKSADESADESAAIQRFADIGAPEAGEFFTQPEEQALLDLVRSRAASAAALRDSLAIVLEERRSYDPAAAKAALLEAAPLRTLIVDTVRHAPEAVGALILRFVVQRM